MKTSIKKRLSSGVFFFAAAMLLSCGAKQQPNAVVETQPQQKQPPKQSNRLAIQQRAEQAFTELDSATDDSQTPSRKTTRSNAPETTTLRESESSRPSAQSNAPTSLPTLTPQKISEGWVDAEGECYQGPKMTTEDAQISAMAQARQNAIAMKCGIAVSAQTLQLQQDFHESFTQLSRSTVYGKIIAEKAPIPSYEITTLETGEPIICHRVTLRAKVAEEEGNPDPSFQVPLKLNDGKVTFLEGDEMILHITPTKDCYITVFNVLSDNTVLLLFPPQEYIRQVAPAGQTFSIPSESERRQGVHFRVGLLSGKRQDTEYIWVVATKADIPFLPEEKVEFRPDISILSGKVVLSTYQSALEEINRWLVSIPLDERTFDMEQYEIRKK